MPRKGPVSPKLSGSNRDCTIAYVTQALIFAVYNLLIDVSRQYSDALTSLT